MKLSIKNNPVILREVFPIFHRDCGEISPMNMPRSEEISPCSRNDNMCWDIYLRLRQIRNDSMGYRDDNMILCKLPLFHNGLKSILLLFLLTFALTTTSSAQNIMQINNVQGVINSTVVVPISITNDEEFISFQCDVLLPDGFTYVASSITLTPRSVDHVVNVTNIGDNTIRILSYSLNNTPFLLDSGIVANFSLATPSTEGDYIIGINNGIIGNAESVNILDSLIFGEINLAPIGISENNLLENSIHCFPVPFNETLTIQLDADFNQSVNIQIYNIKGILLSNHKLDINNAGINNFSFNTQGLLGNNPVNGLYFIQFDFQDGNQKNSIVKRIQLNK